MYKLILAFQWAFLEIGSFTVFDPTEQDFNADPEGPLWLTSFFSSCSDPIFARDCYSFLETVRAARFLERELPGLMRAWSALPRIAVPPVQEVDPRAALLLELQARLLNGSPLQLGFQSSPTVFNDYWRRLTCEGASAVDTVHAVREILAAISDGKEDGGSGEEYSGISPLLFQGELRLTAIEAVRRQQFLRQGEELVHSLALYL